MPFAFAAMRRCTGRTTARSASTSVANARRKAFYRFQYGLLENGFRQISMVDKPIRTAEDLRGMKMRVPDGQMFRDVFTALEAQPVTINIASSTRRSSPARSTARKTRW